MTIDEAIKHCKEVAEAEERSAKLHQRPDRGIKGSGKRYLSCLKCAEEHRQLVEWLKELKDFREQTRWIPCSERLPESEGDYLVTFKLSFMNFIEVCTFNKADWDKGGYDEVIAWMPLPEPYRGGKHTCSECIIKDTDACSKWNTEADEVACEDFVGGDFDAK